MSQARTHRHQTVCHLITALNIGSAWRWFQVFKANNNDDNGSGCVVMSIFVPRHSWTRMNLRAQDKPSNFQTTQGGSHQLKCVQSWRSRTLTTSHSEGQDQLFFSSSKSVGLFDTDDTPTMTLKWSVCLAVRAPVRHSLTHTLG